jgi:hypothetical protein
VGGARVAPVSERGDPAPVTRQGGGKTGTLALWAGLAGLVAVAPILVAGCASDDTEVDFDSGLDATTAQLDASGEGAVEASPDARDASAMNDASAEGDGASGDAQAAQQDAGGGGDGDAGPASLEDGGDGSEDATADAQATSEAG